MTFSGQAGTARSEAGNIVAGYGSSVVRNAKSFSSSMRPTGAVTNVHTYIFTKVSIITFRAASRAKQYLTIFRSLP